MKVFFSGGCKNGKSTLAERTIKALAGDGPLYYIATMIPHDEEDRERIRRHVESRAGLGFITLEQGTDVARCLDSADPEGAFTCSSEDSLCTVREDEPDLGELRVEFVHAVDAGHVHSGFRYRMHVLQALAAQTRVDRCLHAPVQFLVFLQSFVPFSWPGSLRYCWSFRHACL